ncbi:hypothetical protein BCR34DRAFT_135758 [Clohesyomyces aquaticus]|uniref:Uncharacterized protein n=1 Tax=Clohesyomyces aquaticus TaxID=1231657 RepID=A0A1Y2AAQ8_9PLEO|nr:hypothetical protein BCR34DRAFT_135758 [Clohesyomyces aquaticus]
MSFSSYDPRSRSPSPPAAYMPGLSTQPYSYPQPSPLFDPSIGPDFSHPLPPAPTAITIPNALQYLVWLRKRHQGRFAEGEKLFSVLEEMQERLRGAEEALFMLVMGDEEMAYKSAYRSSDVIGSDRKPYEKAEWKAKMNRKAKMVEENELERDPNARTRLTALGCRLQDFLHELEGFAMEGWIKHINAEFAGWERHMRERGLERMNLRHAPPSTSTSSSAPLLPHERASPPRTHTHSPSPSIPRSDYPDPFDTRSMVVETGSLDNPSLTSFQDQDRPRRGTADFSSTATEAGSLFNYESERTSELADGNNSYTFSTRSLSPIEEHPEFEDLPKASEIEDRWLDEAQDLIEDMSHYEHDPSGTHASWTSTDKDSSSISSQGPPFLHIPLPANFTFSPSGKPTSLVTFPSWVSAVHFPNGGTRDQLLGHLRAWFQSQGRSFNTEDLNIMQVRTRVMEFELKKAIARALKTKTTRDEDGAIQIWETESQGNTCIVSGTDVYFHVVEDESDDFEDVTDDDEEGDSKNQNNSYVAEVEYPPSYKHPHLRGGAGELSELQTPCQCHFCSPDSFDEDSEAGYTTPSNVYEGIGYAKFFFPHSNTPTTLEGMKTQYHATFKPSQANSLSWMAEARTRQLRVSELEQRTEVLQRKYDAAREEIERLEKTERETWKRYCDSVKDCMDSMEREAHTGVRLEQKDHPYVAYRTAVKEMRDMAMRVTGQTKPSGKGKGSDLRPNMRGGARERE